MAKTAAKERKPRKPHTPRSPKRRLSIDFATEADMLSFYERVIKPDFVERGDEVAIFKRDGLDTVNITPAGEFIVKRKGDRPFGEMVINTERKLVEKEAS